MRITVTNKKGKVLFTYNQFQRTSKVGKFRIQASKDLKKSIFRLRFTFIKPDGDPKEKKNKIALTDDDKTFAQYNLPDGNLTLIYKDLGMQSINTCLKIHQIMHTPMYTTIHMHHNLY